ncbi:prolyl-tRNA synthetase [Rhizoctonia solani]|uniref:Prolyl-tRNA synthetase n=1 Tax=Rhizoctonia solani TaxID=456999 RepID=A0A8H7IFU6_9AGAM|nr:prolyl-tRNA synthetase [Rhizoctonia solani]
MPLPFPLEIIPHYIQVVQLGLVPTLRDILSQPSLLLNPPRVSQLFFSHVWLILGPNIDSNNRSTKHELLYPHASGVVIDIGAGHGHTMQYLDRKRVTRYVAIEPNPYMHQQIYKMAEKCGFSIEKGEVVVLGCGAEDIETIREAVGETGKADTVVSILSLCSVRDAKQILGRLLNEVVRSGGEVLWYEHVKNPLASVSQIREISTRDQSDDQGVLRDPHPADLLHSVEYRANTDRGWSWNGKAKSAGSRYEESSRPLPFTTCTTRFYSARMVATDELTARLSALSLAPSALAAHPAVSNPGQWKEALGLAPGVPSSFELCKTLVFKPKTAKSATPVPVVVIARDETETSSGALAKKFNLKDLRLATDDLLKDFFALDKDSLSPLALTKDNFSRCQVVLDSTIAGTSAPLALHASSPEATVFLSGKDIATYLTSLETAEAKVHVVDFAALKAEAEATPGGVGPVGKAAPAKKAEDAKIEGAVQIAIGVKKELDFPTWYTNVLIKAEMIDYYSVSGCYILKPWSFTIWERIQQWFDSKIKELDVENSYFPMFVSSKVLEREKDHIEGFAPEVAWVTRAGSTDLEEPIAIRPTSETVMYPYYAKWIQSTATSSQTQPMELGQGHTAHLTRPEADKEVRDILDLYRRVYEELLAVPVIPGVKSEKEKFAGGLYTTTVEGFVPTSGRGIQGATSHCLGQNFSKMFNISVEDPNLSAADKAKLTDPEAGKAYVWQNSWGLSTRTIGVMVMVHGDNQDDGRDEGENLERLLDVVKTLKAVGGVPIRLEIGPLDLEKSSTLSVRRDTSAKSPLPLSDIQTSVPALLETIQADMFARAKAAYDDRLKVVNDWSQLTPTLEQKCVVVIPWCEQESCEDAIKDRSAKEAAEQADERSPSSGAKSLCIPFDQERMGRARKGDQVRWWAGRAKRWTMFGRSY